MNNKATRAPFARQTEIRRLLRIEYRAGAANEMHVAKLRHEMSNLPHRHELNSDKVCGWCFYGTDAYVQTWEQIERETREYEAAADAVLTAALTEQPALVSITCTRTPKGDEFVHMTGCKDLTNPRHSSMDPDGVAQVTFTGKTLAEAIIACDTDWADAFGYEWPVAPENSGEVWSITYGSIQKAPCVIKFERAAKAKIGG